MELSELRLALRRYWLVAVAAMLFWIGIGVVIGVLPPNKYRATATVLASPATVTEGNAAQLIALQVPAIVARVETRTFAAAVRDRVATNVAGASVSLSASSELGTGLIRISAEGRSPTAVARWATTAARHVARVGGNKLVSVEVLDTAQRPSKPYSPKPVITLIGALVAGHLTAILATFAAYRLRGALELESELRRRLQIPIVGQIPVVRSMRRHRSPVDELMAEKHEFAEAIQRMRTNIELALLDVAGNDRIIALGSWGSGEGKSTLTAALGLAIAEGGRDVVVIDCDLRQPTLHDKLGEPTGPGLSQAGRMDLDRLLQPTRHPRLSLLPAGTADRHPSDIIAANLPQVLHRLTQDGRLVLLDAPPIHRIAETPLVLSLAHRIVLVVDASSTKLPEIDRAVTEIRTTGLQVVGVVVNRVRGNHTGAYGAYAGPVPAPGTPAPITRVASVEQPTTETDWPSSTFGT